MKVIIVLRELEGFCFVFLLSFGLTFASSCYSIGHNTLSPCHLCVLPWYAASHEANLAKVILFLLC